MISYRPLFETLKERNLVISDLRNTVLHPTTITKIYNNESVSLRKIEKICLHLNVPIEKVVEILPE
jgi:DNA-binding Xre family transcriptional regulator